MNSKEYISVRAIEVQQPIGIFYIASIDWNDINMIARSDIRRIEKGEGSNVESYLGIQRRLSNSRVKEIGQYVRNIDATFPTAIILHINSYTVLNAGEEEQNEIQNISFDKAKSLMNIRLDYDVASILDGQHRIEGLKEGLGNLSLSERPTFQLNCAIFVDLDMDDQSMVFATVNKAQTKVNKSLVYDLFAFAKTRSPQRTAHNIVRLLNENSNSPFRNMIKILGVADDPERERITQATIAEAIIRYISSEPMKDRDILKRGKKLPKIKGDDEAKYFFRNLFIDEKDADIFKIINNYFNAAKDKWPGQWNSSLLTKSTGVVALMRFLKPAYLNLADEIGKVVSKEEFTELFDQVNIPGSQFTKENYLPGSSGQSQLYKQLLEQTGLEHIK